jgi:hypothetical protein
LEQLIEQALERDGSGSVDGGDIGSGMPGVYARITRPSATQVVLNVLRQLGVLDAATVVVRHQDANTSEEDQYEVVATCLALEHPMPTRSSAPLRRNADLVKVLIGETISDVGSQVGGLALPFAAALTLQATPGQMAALGVAEYVPPILVGLLAGAWIDRQRRRPLLTRVNLARAVLLAVVAEAAALHVLRVDVLYGAGIVLGALGVIFTVAFAAYLPSLVTTASLIVANGARETSSAIADVAGPAFAGILIQILGTAGAIAVDAGSFVASVAGLALVRAVEPTPPPRVARRRLERELADGWRLLLGQPLLRAFTATAFTANFFYRVLMAVYVLYLTRELALSPAIVGLIFGLGGGAGVLFGSALAPAVSHRFGLGRILVLMHALFGVFGLPLALTVGLPWLGAPLVFGGEFAQLSVNAVYMVNRAGVEQAVTPPHLRGRVQGSRTVAHAVGGTLGLLASVHVPTDQAIAPRCASSFAHTRASGGDATRASDAVRVGRRAVEQLLIRRAICGQPYAVGGSLEMRHVEGTRAPAGASHGPMCCMGRWSPRRNGKQVSLSH